MKPCGLREERPERAEIREPAEPLPGAPSRFAFSTCWNAWRHPDGRSMVEEILRIGFSRVELSHGIHPEMLEGVESMVRAGRVRVVSLHNFCPFPPSADRRAMGPDVYLLSALDEGERRWAVGQTVNTLETAARLGAPVVVLHLGRVEVRCGFHRLAFHAERGLGGSRRCVRLRRTIGRKRQKRAGPYVEASRRSLEELAPHAERLGLRLALENRFYPRDIPSFDEMETFLASYPPDLVGYWHDVGHAQVGENLGLRRHEEYLKSYGGRLLGLHVHDVAGMRDHLAPGRGEFDFRRLRPYVGKGLPMVLELQPAELAGEIRQGLSRLDCLPDPGKGEDDAHG